LPSVPLWMTPVTVPAEAGFTKATRRTIAIIAEKRVVIPSEARDLLFQKRPGKKRIPRRASPRGTELVLRSSE
jgi:hypothetical protein